MTPGSGTETGARSDASITAQAARAKELRLLLAVIGFQRSFTRWRWLLDPLPLELTSQVETDQPLLSCPARGSLRVSTAPHEPLFRHPVVEDRGDRRVRGRRDQRGEPLAELRQPCVVAGEVPVGLGDR